MGDIATNTARTHEQLMNGKWRTRGFHEFNLIERGKLRHIREKRRRMDRFYNKLFA